MKYLAKIVVILALPLIAMGGCTKEAGPTLPQTPPDKVVITFFDLLSQGGRLTIREAYDMLSTSYGRPDPNAFRKWTEGFSGESKIKIIESKIPQAPDENGNLVAVVKMEVQTPSSFGGHFSVSSRMNLILDEESHTWKIDFMAYSVNEDAYRKAPAEARAEPEKEI